MKSIMKRAVSLIAVAAMLATLCIVPPAFADANPKLDVQLRMFSDESGTVLTDSDVSAAGSIFYVEYWVVPKISSFITTVSAVLSYDDALLTVQKFSGKTGKLIGDATTNEILIGGASPTFGETTDSSYPGRNAIIAGVTGSYATPVSSPKVLFRFKFKTDSATTVADIAKTFTVEPDFGSRKSSVKNDSTTTVTDPDGDFIEDKSGTTTCTYDVTYNICPYLDVSQKDGVNIYDTASDTDIIDAITANYIDAGGNPTSVDPKDISVKDFSGLTAGDNTVTVVVNGTEKQITVNAVADGLDSIAVKTAPNKTEYTSGENFDPAGLVITATYKSGATKDITYSVDNDADFTFVPEEGLKVANDKVAISYKIGGDTKTVDQTIKVNKINVAVPEIATKEYDYDGNQKTFSYTNDGEAYYTHTTNVGTDAKDYPVTFQLKDKTETQWVGGSTEDITINCKINKAGQTINVAASRTFTYGDTGAVVGASVTKGDGALTYTVSPDSSVIEVAPNGAITVKKAGTATITVKAAATTNYGEATKTVSVTVNPKPITITEAKAVDRAYNESKAVEIEYVRFGDTKLVKGTGYTATGSMDDANAGNNKNVNVEVTLLDGNYTLADDTTTTTVNISKVNQQPTVTSPKNLAKGSNSIDLKSLISNIKGDKEPTFGISFGGSYATLVGSTLTSGSTSGQTVKISFRIAESANYNSYTSADDAIVINIVDKEDAGVDLSYTVDPDTITYGDEDFKIDASVGNPGASGETKWKSSNENVATVNEDGNVTIVGAGEAIITATYESDTTLGDDSLKISVAKKTVSITGISVSDKTYNGLTNATITGSPVLNGKVGSDDVYVQNSDATAAFADKNVGTDKSVTVNGYQLRGEKAGNYQLSGQPTGLKADITAKSVFISKVTIQDKTYDGTTDATLLADPEISGYILGDDVKIVKADAAAAFGDKNVGANKGVTGTVTGLSGADAGNYTLDSKTFIGMAAITKANAPSLTGSTGQQKYTQTGLTKESPVSGIPADSGKHSFSIGTPSPIAKVASYSIDPDTGKITATLQSIAAGNTITFPVTVTMQNYKDATANFELTITEKDPQAALVITSGTSVTYGNTLNLTTTGGSGTGAVTYTVYRGTGDANVVGNVLTPTKAGTIQVMATKAGDNDYNETTSAKVTITIGKATPNVTPTYDAINQNDKTLGDANLDYDKTVSGNVPGTIVWDDGDSTKAEANKSYNWTFTPDDTTNYNTVSGKLTPYVVYEGNTTLYPIDVSTSGKGDADAYPAAAAEGNVVHIVVEPEKGNKVTGIVVTDGEGNVIPVKQEGDDLFSFVMPDSKANVKVTFTSEGTGAFSDVKPGSYYEDAVDWAVLNGITNGLTASTFGPDVPCTRAQVVTFLWRSAGCPVVSNGSTFTDVKPGSYYEQAVAWAVAAGITKGTSATTFSPDDICTRAQIVTFLCRFAQGGAVGTVNPFKDVKSTAYYADSVLWAVENGITKGTSATTFSPDDLCTRAQVVTFLYRFYVK